MTKELERQLIEIVAWDRIDRPISSMSGKLKRGKPKMAQSVDLDQYKGSYEGDRVWARLDDVDKQKARGMKEGVEKFSAEFPKYGKILQGYIEEQRTIREQHLVFGMQEGCKLTADDYMGVMQSLGFTPATSRGLYPELMDISRKMARKRDESERSILIETKI
jgi:hypothetical protein